MYLHAAVLVTLIALVTPATSCDTYVTFAFDDSFKSSLGMAEYLDKHDWHATFYTVPARLGCLHKDYMNWWDVWRLDQKGHEIACHGFSHEETTKLDYTGAKNQFCICRAILRRFGPPSSFGYPFGKVNQTIKTIAQECGYSNGRAIGGPHELIPPEDVWKLKSYSVKREDTFDTLKSQLEQVIADSSTTTNKWLILNNHVMCEAEDVKCSSRYPFSILRSTYVTFLDYVQKLSGEGTVCVKSVREVLKPIVQDIPEFLNSIDLPSDFIFDPALDPNIAAATLHSVSLLLIVVLLILVLV